MWYLLFPQWYLQPSHSYWFRISRQKTNESVEHFSSSLNITNHSNVLGSVILLLLNCYYFTTKSFLYLLKTLEKQVYLRFQGVKKRTFDWNDLSQENWVQAESKKIEAVKLDTRTWRKSNKKHILQWHTDSIFFGLK